VKGTDYWTAADKEEIAGEAVDKLKEQVDWLATKTKTDDGQYVLPRTSVSFTSDNAIVTGTQYNLLVNGGAYVVDWNGVLYDCVCKIDGDGGLYLGNGNLIGVSDTSDEPFCILNYGGTGSTIYKDTNSAETIVLSAVYGFGYVYNKMPEEYLPEAVPVVKKAAVGQVIMVKAVDKNGVPTEWVAADFSADGSVTIETHADWSQNDPEQPDYVKNRTHYEIVDITEILPETTPTYSESDNGFVLSDVISFADGETYVVNWNGTDYICVARKNGDLYYALGNAHVANAGADTGEPFYMMFFSADFAADLGGRGALIKSTNGSEPVTFSIRQDKSVVVPLPTKFLHKSMPWVDESVLLKESEAEAYTHPSFGRTWLIESAPELEIGKTYTVVYNGVSYDCVCQSAPAGFTSDVNAVAMGNFSVAGGPNTGEPFAMLISGLYNRVDVIDLSGAASVKAKICEVVINKLDNRCLDLTVFTFDGVNVTCNHTHTEIVERITNGTLSAVLRVATADLVTELLGGCFYVSWGDNFDSVACISFSTYIPQMTTNGIPDTWAVMNMGVISTVSGFSFQNITT